MRRPAEIKDHLPSFRLPEKIVNVFDKINWRKVAGYGLIAILAAYTAIKISEKIKMKKTIAALAQYGERYEGVVTDIDVENDVLTQIDEVSGETLTKNVYDITFTVLTDQGDTIEFTIQDVTPDVAKAVGELKKGKISFKNDDTGNIHVVIGKVSFDNEKLVENFETLLETVKKVKPASSKGVYIKNISISSSMGPGVKVQL